MKMCYLKICLISMFNDPICQGKHWQAKWMLDTLPRSEEGTEAKPNPHSDCSGEESLAGWTKKQHADCTKFKRGSPTDMICKRKKIFIQAGFPFKLSNDERWDLCAKELSYSMTKMLDSIGFFRGRSINRETNMWLCGCWCTSWVN